ncbi:hypothetical protein TrVFT333_002020 [Trichoderma virens FT-333]|nr:hypothetical protein TrVFT333_002020 [Trichoderma virens FT-333]
MFEEESRYPSQSSQSPAEEEEDDQISMLPEPEPKDVLSDPVSESLISPSSSSASGCGIAKSKMAEIPASNTAQQTEKQAITTARAAMISKGHMIRAIANTIQEERPMPATAPMLGASSVGTGYMDITHGGYQQPLIYQGAMQHIVNPMQPQQQQYNTALWSDPMQWVNFDGEDNKRLM